MNGINIFKINENDIFLTSNKTITYIYKTSDPVKDFFVKNEIIYFIDSSFLWFQNYKKIKLIIFQSLIFTYSLKALKLDIY